MTRPFFLSLPGSLKLNRIHPAQLILASYLLAIIVGSGLLLLPISTTTGTISWVDAVFTATSAVCVNGLVVVETGRYFTFFGQCVILALVQLGGLGIMTISVAIFRLIGRQVSYRERVTVQDVFTHSPKEDVYNLLKAIFLFTLISECLGAGLLFMTWQGEYPPLQALYYSVFHAISAFCNGGFFLFDNGVVDYQASPLVNIALSGLILLGGIGFPTVYDLYQSKIRPVRRMKLMAQTKAVLWTTGVLIVLGAVLFGLSENHYLLQGMSFSEKTMISLFQSITCRSGGYNTVDIAGLNETTLTMMMFLMFIGASPGSCGGGVKTTTLAIMSKFVVSRLKREQQVNLFKKTVPNETLIKCAVLILLSLGVIFVMFFFLMWVEPESSHTLAQDRFVSYLFETISAFGTVGLSMGVTPQLGLFGKMGIILLMLVGRVGILTVAYVLVGSMATRGHEYAEENIMVG